MGAIINIQNSVGTINASQLPDIMVGVTINGGTSNTLSGQNQNRIFFINAPGQSVNITNLTLGNGLAQGGNGGQSGGGGSGGGGAGLGGAVFINAGNVNFSSVAFANNSAKGGSGADAAFGGGGGGGGMGFSGGDGASNVYVGGLGFGGGGGGGAVNIRREYVCWRWIGGERCVMAGGRACRGRKRSQPFLAEWRRWRRWL